MTKPYSLIELVVRIQVLTKRRTNKQILQGGVYIDCDNKILNVLGKNVLLSEQEFKIFMIFYKNPKALYSKEDLLKSIWNDNTEIGIVPVCIMKLRRKLECAEAVVGRITNEYGAGYRFIPPNKRFAHASEEG